MEGLVLKSTGSWYEVLANTGERYICRTRGKLRLQGFKTTNPIAVGDRVLFEPESDYEQQGVITDVMPRENYIIRKSIKKTSHGHIIAANIDQALLVVTLVYPRTSLGFIDRFLVSAESFRIPQLLVFNKLDILSEEEKAQQKDIIGVYESIGIPCFEISAQENMGIETVKEQLKHRKTLISGHSGVGKSTFLNLLSSEINQTIGEVSDYAEKGVHTTTFAEMFAIDEDTHVIDTPGIKELGLIDIEKEELSDYFPEMRALSGACKFRNCTHINEPKCAIQDAVDAGEIAEKRYESYLSMFYEEDTHR